MKKISRILLTLMLVTVLGLSSTTYSFAKTSTAGGTWNVTDWKSSDVLSYESLPAKVVYLPYSQVKALHNADLDNKNVIKYLKKYGAVKLTTAIAKKISAKTGARLVPLVGYAFLCSDLLKMAQKDAVAKGINKAYKAGKGMKCTLYVLAGGALTWKYTNWNGKSMPEKINFKNISGYALGKVTVGKYDISENW